MDRLLHESTGDKVSFNLKYTFDIFVSTQAIETWSGTSANFKAFIMSCDLI